jgi:hypothetical protein
MGGNTLWGSLRVTLIDHGDDRVPTDLIRIYSYKRLCTIRRVRNTAGEAFNVQLYWGGWTVITWSSKLSNVVRRTVFS